MTDAPEVCPYCNSERSGIDGPIIAFKCYTTVRLDRKNKPHARRTMKCIAIANGATYVKKQDALDAFDEAWNKLHAATR
jgi:hypothetical protein